MIVYYSHGLMCNGLFQYSYLRSFAKPDEKIFCIDGLMGAMKDIDECFDLNDPNFHFYSPNKVIADIFRLIFFPCIYWLAKIRLFNYVWQIDDCSATSRSGLIPISVVKTDFFQNEAFLSEHKVRVKVKEIYMQKAMELFNGLPKDRTKVFVHIRRGDYLKEIYKNDDVTYIVEPTRGINLPISYYNNAINLIGKEIDSPYYIFLSDDPEFVEQSFRHISQANKYISKNSPIVDFSLMSLCEYGICSNSSFSWWGSYFMSKKQKVFFPKYWQGWKLREESHPGIQPSWSNVIDVD
jgi:hypothetical protein